MLADGSFQFNCVLSENDRSELRAVTTNPIEWSQKAKTLLKQAKNIGTRTEGRKARYNQNSAFAISPKFHTKQEVKFTNLAAEAFRVCGEQHWFDSAKAYSRAATLSADALHHSASAADLFTEAGIVMEKVDTNFANEYYRKAVSQHCNANQYNAAASIQERMAINFHKRGDDDAAIEEYQRASKLYGAAKMQDASDRALERAAHLMGATGKYRDAAFVYQSLAISQTHQNIQVFNVPNVMLRGSLLLLHDCLLALGPNKTDLGDVVDFVEKVYVLDCRLSESRQHDFIVDLIQYVKRGDLDVFADCVYSFNDLCSGFDELMLTALDGIKKHVAAKRK